VPTKKLEIEGWERLRPRNQIQHELLEGHPAATMRSTTAAGRYPPAADMRIQSRRSALSIGSYAKASLGKKPASASAPDVVM